MDIKDLIIRYGVVSRRRFTYKEKFRFLKGILKEFMDFNMDTDIKEAERNQRKAYNMYIGDLDKSDIIISTYYDTPPKTFNLIKHKVCSPKSDSKAFKTSILIALVTLGIIGAGFIQYVFKPVWADGVFKFMDCASVAFMFLIIYLMFKFRNGIGNTSNFIRNTASIISIIKLANDMPAKKRKHLAFALTDYGCINHFGDEMLRSEVKEGYDKKTVIFLDCIGSNENIKIIYHKSAKSIVEKLSESKFKDIEYIEIEDDNRQYYNFFKKSIIITSGKVENGAITIDKVNTAKDNDMNEENVLLVSSILMEIVDNKVNND